MTKPHPTDLSDGDRARHKHLVAARILQTDSRTMVASSLGTYLEWWLDGRPSI